MANAPILSASDFRQLLDYNPDTGLLAWRERPSSMFVDLAHAKSWNKRNAGKPALNHLKTGGYKGGTMLGRQYQAHRVIWAICNGKCLPEGSFVDHIDGDPANNRIENLRLVTPAESAMNTTKKRDGLRGACFHKRKQRWTASIRVHLGYFDTEEEAAAAYEAAAKSLHQKHYLKNGVRKIKR